MMYYRTRTKRCAAKICKLALRRTRILLRILSKELSINAGIRVDVGDMEQVVIAFVGSKSSHGLR